MKMIVFIIRWVLSIALIYGAYAETGKWTALCLLLIFISIEMLTYLREPRRDDVAQAQARFLNIQAKMMMKGNALKSARAQAKVLGSRAQHFIRIAKAWLVKVWQCYLWKNHDWTCNAMESIPATPEQLAGGLDGFYDYAKMYCKRCKTVSKLSDRSKRRRNG